MMIDQYQQVLSEEITNIFLWCRLRKLIAFRLDLTVNEYPNYPYLHKNYRYPFFGISFLLAAFPPELLH